MAGSPEQAAQLDILDRLALLTDMDELLQAVITRLANRAKTADEGDDIALLIQVRGTLAHYRTLVAQCHKSRRN